MYPSIPLDELIDMLAQKISVRVANVVAREMFGYRIRWCGGFYTVGLGLPIGHPWSPELARFYVCVKEQRFVESTGCALTLRPVIFVRYTDDICLVTPVRRCKEIKRLYEECISPLRVEWNGDKTPYVKFLNIQLRRFPKTDVMCGAKLIDKGNWPGGAFPRKLLAGVGIGKVFALSTLHAVFRHWVDMPYAPRVLLDRILARQLNVPGLDNLLKSAKDAGVVLPKIRKKKEWKRSELYESKEGEQEGPFRHVRSLYTLLRIGLAALHPKRKSV
jgi:hypothetical protein